MTSYFVIPLTHQIKLQAPQCILKQTKDICNEVHGDRFPNQTMETKVNNTMFVRLFRFIILSKYTHILDTMHVNVICNLKHFTITMTKMTQCTCNGTDHCNKTKLSSSI